ncbi:Dual specificity phosphatase, catalytic domain [Rheinheimera pacifica]|uniref:Dual specificity phosphatase, catalytic domain n=1 Tax=Rheinheimera pacifica TaxID=173990 RepID=A0A1H6J8I4_9GAMM|nr:dual specificity protein phosphatase family protein [Rheinheimera pacifica]SEH58333.1 Dual specificity phosphatase, catalytic domain [Rheinheimera pacifica]
MRHPFDILTLSTGQLIFTPCPGTKGVSLTNSIAQLKAAGAAAIITMMPQQELTQNNVDNLGAICSELGLQWFQLPVEDDCAPQQPFEQAFAAHKAAILALLQNGNTVAIHCKGGSGRTGLMAAILMTQLGYSKADATAQVQSLRPKALGLAVHQAYFAALAEQPG